MNENKIKINFLPIIIKSNSGSKPRDKNLLENIGNTHYKGGQSHNTSISKFYSTKSDRNKFDFVKNFNAGSKSPNIMIEESLEIEGDLQKLHDIYYNVNGGGLKTNKHEKKEIFSKFNIDNSVSQEEIDHIYSALKTSSNLTGNSNNSYGQTFNTAISKNNITTTQTNQNGYTSLNKAAISIFKEHYKDPINSMKKLKRNKQIHDNIVNLITQKQVQMYNEKYEKNLDYFNKVEKMPNPRVSLHMVSSKIKEQFNEKEEIKSKKENNIEIKQNKYVSKDDILSLSEFHGGFATFSKFRPSSRCQATLTITSNGIYLIGGVNTDRLIDFWKLDILETNIYEWSMVKITGEIPLPRMGHSSVFYKNQIFIYGGNVESDPQMPKDDITIFNIETRRVCIERCQNKNNLRWRRNHIAEVVGNQMIIYGGIDEKGEYLSDCYLLDLDYLRWREIFPKEISYKPLPLAYHSSSCVLSNDKKYHSNLSVFKFPDLPKLSTNKLKYEGIYIFGGIDKDGNCNNELKILKIGKKPLEWISPQICGDPPCPRHSSTISFYENLEIIILHGGRNDNIKPNTFNDVYILSLNIFKWIKVKIFDQIPKNRSDHCCTIFNNKLIIFGGTDTECYLGSEIFLLNLDFYDNKKKKNDFLYLKNIGVKENYSENLKLKNKESRNILAGANNGILSSRSITKSSYNETDTYKSPLIKKLSSNLKNFSSNKKSYEDNSKENQGGYEKKLSKLKSLLTINSNNLVPLIKKGSLFSTFSNNVLNENKNLTIENASEKKTRHEKKTSMNVENFKRINEEF